MPGKRIDNFLLFPPLRSKLEGGVCKIYSPCPIMQWDWKLWWKLEREDEHNQTENILDKNSKYFLLENFFFVCCCQNLLWFSEKKILHFPFWFILFLFTSCLPIFAPLHYFLFGYFGHCINTNLWMRVRKIDFLCCSHESRLCDKIYDFF